VRSLDVDLCGEVLDPGVTVQLMADEGRYKGNHGQYECGETFHFFGEDTWYQRSQTILKPTSRWYMRQNPSASVPGRMILNAEQLPQCLASVPLR
jgi:hypothetical protein